MSLRNKLHSRIQELIAFRKRCWKQCKKWVTKSRHSFEQNTSSSTVYEITDPIFGPVGSVNDDSVEELHQSIEDSHASFEIDLEQAWSSLDEAECKLTESEKEQMRREKRLARTRNSLRNSSLAKSKRNDLQKQERCQLWLLAQSKRNIRIGQETFQRENEYFSNVMAITSQPS
jgi:hypothetical protein